MRQDQSTGKAKYGFLEFQELDAAVKTIEAYNGREVGGNTMAVGFAKPKGGAAPQQGGGGGGAQESSRLFVGNIGAGATVGQSTEWANRQASTEHARASVSMQLSLMFAAVFVVSR